MGLDMKFRLEPVGDDTLKLIPADGKKHCDFCGVITPEGVLNILNTDKVIMVALINPNVVVNYGAQWGACDTCFDFIHRDDWRGLVNHCYYASSPHRYSKHEYKRLMMSLYKKVRKHLIRQMIQ